jgi:GT2 family glycosyltransferase
MSALPLTVGITTRNRPAAVQRALSSLGRLAHLNPEVLVFDDASDEPVDAYCAPARAAGIRLDVIRSSDHVGYIAGRNLLVDRASHPYVLLLDDDAFILAADPVERALGALAADPALLAVAFAQAEADGRPWQRTMQPSPVERTACISAFIGFAHLLRRELFLRLGGYRTEFFFYGEEKDLCLRGLQAGVRVLYLPDALVAHVPDPGGRTAARYVRSVIRNDILFGLFNEPLPIAACGLPLRLWRYRAMARAHGDAGGLGWILREIRSQWPSVRRLRRPVSWRTMREWRRLARHPRPYPQA